MIGQQQNFALLHWCWYHGNRSNSSYRCWLWTTDCSPDGKINFRRWHCDSVLQILEANICLWWILLVSPTSRRTTRVPPVYLRKYVYQTVRGFRIGAKVLLSCVRRPSGSADLLCCSNTLCCVLLCCEAHSDRKPAISLQQHSTQLLEAFVTVQGHMTQEEVAPLCLAMVRA